MSFRLCTLFLNAPRTLKNSILLEKSQNVHKKHQRLYADFEYTIYLFDKEVLQKIFKNIYLLYSFCSG